MGGACLGGQPTSLHLHKCVARFGSDSAVQWRIQDFWKGAGGDEWPKTKIGWGVGRGATSWGGPVPFPRKFLKFCF